VDLKIRFLPFKFPKLPCAKRPLPLLLVKNYLTKIESLFIFLNDQIFCASFYFELKTLYDFINYVLKYAFAMQYISLLANERIYLYPKLSTNKILPATCRKPKRPLLLLLI
jgi:hypothetical protein